MNYSKEIANTKEQILKLELHLAHLERMQTIEKQLESEKMTNKEKLVRLSIKALAKVTRKTAEFKTPSNGTVRFTLTNKAGKVSQGFYRVRVNKLRKLELQKGDTFTQVHKGKVTIAFETAAIRSAFNFSLAAL